MRVLQSRKAVVRLFLCSYYVCVCVCVRCFDIVCEKKIKKIISMLKINISLLLFLFFLSSLVIYILASSSNDTSADSDRSENNDDSDYMSFDDTESSENKPANSATSSFHLALNASDLNGTSKPSGFGRPRGGDDTSAGGGSQTMLEMQNENAKLKRKNEKLKRWKAKAKDSLRNFKGMITEFTKEVAEEEAAKASAKRSRRGDKKSGTSFFSSFVCVFYFDVVVFQDEER